MQLKVLVVAAAVLALAGCGKSVQSKDAIRQGVIDHLSKRAGLDVKLMDIEVTSVSFRENEADAVVSFRPKGSKDASAGMSMSYTLERQGSRWAVKARKDSGGMTHGGGQKFEMPPMPAEHPPMGKQAPPEKGK